MSQDINHCGSCGKFKPQPNQNYLYSGPVCDCLYGQQVQKGFNGYPYDSSRDQNTQRLERQINEMDMKLDRLHTIVKQLLTLLQSK